MYKHVWLWGGIFSLAACSGGGTITDGDKIVSCTKEAGTQDCIDAGLIDHICIDANDDHWGRCIPRSLLTMVSECSPTDAGDAGPVDAGEEPDAGSPDAGIDAGNPDAGDADAGEEPDAGVVVTLIGITDVVHTETESCSNFTWKTDVAATTMLQVTPYIAGTANDFFNASYREVGQTGLRSSHQVEVCGFAPSTRMTYKIVATDGAGGGYGDKVGDFTTLIRADRDPPEIKFAGSTHSTTDETFLLVVADEPGKLIEVFYKTTAATTYAKQTFALNQPMEAVMLSIAGLTEGTRYTAYAMFYDSASNPSSPSASFQFTTLSVMRDFISPVIGSFEAGAETYSTKTGFYADEPLSEAELWVATSESSLNTTSAQKFPFTMPSGRTSASGGSIVATNLTPNRLYYHKVVGKDLAGNWSESPVFTNSTKLAPTAPPPLTATVWRGEVTQTPSSAFDLYVATERSVAMEVRWGLNPALTTFTATTVQSGVNFQKFALTGLPAASTIFYKAILVEGSNPAVESATDSFITWAPGPTTDISLRCDTSAGPGCQVTTYSLRNNGNAERGSVMSFPIKWSCLNVMDRFPNPDEVIRATTDAGPDKLRLFSYTGQPVKVNGSYVLPRSKRANEGDLVALSDVLLDCPSLVY